MVTIAFEFDYFNPIYLLLICLAVYRLTRLFVEDEITASIREAIWKSHPPETSSLGYLFTCYWCMGMWVSIIFGALYLLFPSVMIVAAMIFSFSAIAAIIAELLHR